MGLDITAYPTAVLLPAHEWSEDCYDGHARPFCYDGHQRSARNLLLTDYHTDNGGYWTGPCYEVDHAKAFPFAAGSYSGYNAFREALCVAALDLKAPSRLGESRPLRRCTVLRVDPFRRQRGHHRR